MTNNEINQTALQEFWDKISLKLSFEQIDEFVRMRVHHTCTMVGGGTNHLNNTTN